MSRGSSFRLLCVCFSVFVLAAASSVLSGCGKKSGPALIPVSGKVTMEGSGPVTAGNVVLIPDSEKGVGASGQLDSSGNYDVQSEGRKGAAAGKYKIIITPPTMPAPGQDPKKMNKFHPKYQDAKITPLAYEVKPDAPAGTYDLKVTPP